jgi:hypothetical protein
VEAHQYDEVILPPYPPTIEIDEPVVVEENGYEAVSA